jgi:hypothetical protein
VRNEKARRFLMNMRRKPGVTFPAYFTRADTGALRLLKRMLAFDPAERPTCEEALADPYFAGLSQPGREPSAQPVSKLSFDFERRKLTTDEARPRGPARPPARLPCGRMEPGCGGGEPRPGGAGRERARAPRAQVRDLIYREILEYHPHMLADYLAGGKQQASFMYPSAVDNFKRQFAHLEAGGAGARMGANANLGQVRGRARAGGAPLWCPAAAPPPYRLPSSPAPPAMFAELRRLAGDAIAVWCRRKQRSGAREPGRAAGWAACALGRRTPPAAMRAAAACHAFCSGGAAAVSAPRGAARAQATSLPRERVKEFQNEAQRYMGQPRGGEAPQVWDRTGARAAVDNIGSGVSKMSVVEGNGYRPPPGPPPTAEQKAQNLLRSNSFQ